jgi:RNA polymerase sigma-70 factor, ECF subfamily
MRKRRRVRDLPARQDIDVPENRSPERDILRSEVEAAVARAIAELPDTQKEVLILVHYEQMPLAEIAAMMDLEIGAVKSRLQRARASLKEMLTAYAPGMERKP